MLEAWFTNCGRKAALNTRGSSPHPGLPAEGVRGLVRDGYFVATSVQPSGSQVRERRT